MSATSEQQQQPCPAAASSILSVQRLHAGIQLAVAENARLQRHPALARVLSATASNDTTSANAAAHNALQALASCMVHEDLLVTIIKHLRPFAMDLLARLLDPSLVLYDEHDSAFVACTDAMKRSELTAAALATLLAFIPQTLNVVQQHFLDSPCFFEFVNVAAAQRKPQSSASSGAPTAVQLRLRQIVQTAYRLLRLQPHAFRSLWNWSSFFPLCFHADVRIRWYAARATAVVLQMSNAQRNTFVNGLHVGEDAAAQSTQPDVRAIELSEHARDIATQEQRIVMTAYEPEPSDAALDALAAQTVPFHDSLKNIFGVVVPSTATTRSSQDAANSTLDALVPTASTQRNLQSLAIALGLKRPILVAGDGGCGKTASIRELARLAGHDDMVELHLDDQIDSKTLLGSYVCTDIPGEFTWQPGALTTAVTAGRWVVIEDIDRAPFEVLAALMPLLETREMVIPGRGELLVAHANFQIFGTTCHGHNMPKGFQESIWTHVDVHALNDDEVLEILSTRFDTIPRHVLDKVMLTYNLVSGNAVAVSSTTAGPSSAAALAHLWKETRRNYGRDFCLRDLLKWCKRIVSFGFAGGSAGASTAVTSSSAYVTEDARLRILVEALDVFCAGIREPATRARAALAIGAVWDVADDKVQYVLEQAKPHVAFNLHEVALGRVHLPTLSAHEQQQNGSSASSLSSVVMTGHVLRLLEKLAAIVYTCEPALLIGETGCGKTTIIQHLAASLGQKLVVQNLNIQSDSSDLVGGFKPVEIHLLARPLYMAFVDLFGQSFAQKSNAGFLNLVRLAFEHKDWKKLVKGMRKAIQMASTKFGSSAGSADGSPRTKTIASAASPNVLLAKWDDFAADVSRFERQKEQVESHFAFAFVEGVLVKALREGHWVLLDEINLASSDTLERISTLLEHETSAFSLTERGDVEVIRPHPNFRIFGAMNPSTDVGKKDLPPSLRNRFTEIYVDECVCPSDLQMVVQHHLKEIAGAPVPETVAFYLEARKLADDRLSDGARHKPRYSLRTLSQALHITRILIQRGYGVERALYEGFASSFCTQLDMDSRTYLERVIKNTFAKTMKAKDLARAPPRPGGKATTNDFVLVSSYWVRQGGHMDPRDDAVPDPVTHRKKFVLTKSVDENLRHLARSAVIGKYPVLLQGPTSAGKTSLIGYLAARIGQKCVRINNHEHTDIQEYLGSYVSDANGKLAFKEGVLVEAVRNGWWIILDELNLAPSEVLEALNRLLDDNRELFLPETQETVTPHPKFMLFATQNPPGLYGGRKVLSRAFRNRFLEIQVDEVASSELQTILQERSYLPPSYCAILIDIMRQLQLIRQQSSVFAGKGGFITTRDLLRWAERRPATKQALAEEGYCLLAERLRKDDEKDVVKRVLEQKCNVTIDIDELYYRGTPRESNLLNEDGVVEEETVWGTAEQFEQVQALIEAATASGKTVEGNAAGLEKISVTKSLRRLFALVGRCLQHEEPVLLVGETGCGKTTVCQLYSLLLNQHLHILNCHQHTETSDFLGCLRPVRGKEQVALTLQTAVLEFLTAATDRASEDAEAQVEAYKAMDIGALLAAYDAVRARVVKTLEAETSDGDDAMDAPQSQPLRQLLERVDSLKRRHQSIFEWVDGPLVESMKNGDLILVDEVNLAEDAVLERLNSVLEPSRGLLLAEKGGDQVEEITADPKWRIMATMNPGGDFGKRELSPALRNRFTEIWVPAISDLDDIATIIRDRLVGASLKAPAPVAAAAVPPPTALAPLCDPILRFVQSFNAANGRLGGVGAVTLRDILSWINFITSVMKDQGGAGISPWVAFVQGAALSILDGLGLGADSALHTAMRARDDAYKVLLDLVPSDDSGVKEQVLASLHATQQALDDRISHLTTQDGAAFGIEPFVIARGPDPTLKKPSFSLKAPTTMSNLYRVLRAMQVNRPIILEGSPGVGKTSLISALASASGHRLVRINLSEQTDISDLFGSDLPAAAKESATAADGSSDSASGMFEWCDGVFLRALKAGDWVLLDELNLASQSVLEGLNSCLDHRGTVYIPELDRSFECPRTFRVFAAQNPLRQGGGRKGLPKSFLNRFTRVFVETLHEQDLIHIATSMYPKLAGAAAIEGEATAASPMQLDAEAGTASAIVSIERPVAGKSVLEKLIAFNSRVHEDTMVACKYGRMGAPWEFNLRDVFRFCALLETQHVASGSPQELHALRYFVNFIYVERMRSARDRSLLSLRFAEVFGAAPMALGNVALRISEDHVEVGNAFLARRKLLRVQRVSPPLFNFLLKPMEALVHCVNMNWPALLVGPAASGKTSAVRLLAALSGNTLHELGMSAGTDATELLGCFEQVDVGRKAREIKHRVADVYEQTVQDLLVAALGAAPATKSALLKLANQLSGTWWALGKRERAANDASSASATKRKQLTKGELDDVLIDLLRNLLSLVPKAVESLGSATAADRRAAVLAAVATLEHDVESVVALSKSTTIASSFEWVDGTLIHAMEHGEWLLLDNVNFCSSSVLDRLNSLMETGGELLINECGVLNGQLRVIKPHANFRIFLAMDAQYGEVSRAMRNRCVEIALLAHDEHRLDLVKVASASGVPGFALCRAFQSVHERVVAALAASPLGARAARINRRHLANWSQLAATELNRGIAPLTAIGDAFQRVYGGDVLVQLGLERDALELFQTALAASAASPSLHRVFPQVTATLELCQEAESVVVKRDHAYVEYLFALSAAAAASQDPAQSADALLACLASDAAQVAVETEAADPRTKSWLQVLKAREAKAATSAVYAPAILDEAASHVSAKDFLTVASSTPAAPLSLTLLPFALRRIVHVSLSSFGAVSSERLLFTLEKIATAAQAPAMVATAELARRFVASLLQHDVFVAIAAEMDAHMVRFSDLVGPASSLVGHGKYPVYLSANDAAFQQVHCALLDVAAARPDKKDDADALWRAIVATQARLELLDGSEWLRFCEEEQYRAIDNVLAPSATKASKKATSKVKRAAEDFDTSAYSVLQQSYAMHTYHTDRSSAENELVFLLYPFFQTVDAFVKAFVTSSRDASDAIAALVKTALRDRFELSIQLRAHAFDWTHFLIHWQWTSKSLLRLDAALRATAAEERPTTWSEAWDSVVDMVHRVEAMIEKLIGCSAKKHVLWKRGGHSLLPTTRELWNARYLLDRLTATYMSGHSLFAPLQLQATGDATTLDGAVDVFALLFGGIASMEAAMKTGRLDISSLFFVDVEARKEILYALCAFSYLTQQASSSAAGKSTEARAANPHAKMAEELTKLPGALLKKLREKQSEVTAMIASKTLYLSEIEADAENHVDLLSEEDSRIGKDAPILLFDMAESSRLMERLVTFQLSPLLEHALMRREVHVIGDLVRVMNQYELRPRSDAADAHAMTALVHEIDHVLQALDALVEELLALGLRDPASFHAFQDIVWCGHKFIQSTGDVDASLDLETELAAFFALVKTHVHSVLFGFHQALRVNSFNQLDLISFETFDAHKKLRKASKAAAPSRDEDETTHAVFGLPRVFQCVQSAVVLKSVAEVDLHESTCGTIEAQVRTLRLDRIKTHFIAAQAHATQDAAVSTRALLQELVVATLLAFESTFDSVDAWPTVQRLLAAFVAPSGPADRATELLRALKHSRDETFVGTLEPFVRPLLASLAHLASTDSVSPLAIGESFVLVGLWRFALLLPSSPVDPVTKPLVKKEMLLSRLGMLTLQRAVDGAIDRVNARPAPSAETERAATEAFTRVLDDVLAVSAYAIQRYEPRQRGTSALNALADADATSPVPMNAVAPSKFGELFRDLLRFQTTIMPASKLLALVAAVRGSSQSSANKRHQVLRELDMFQQTTESFVTQLSNKFGASFSDMVEPIAAAIYAVKEGVAMLAWTLYLELQHASVDTDEKRALALSLVAFPSTPTSMVRASDDTSVRDPWRAIQHLLQIVGTKTTSLVFGGAKQTRKSDMALLDVALAKLEFLFRETLLSRDVVLAPDAAAAVLDDAMQCSKVLFDLFLAKWQEQQAREEAKRREEEELFKYKTRTVEIESEDQLLEQEYRQQFPDYSATDFEAFLSPAQAQAAAGALSSSLATAADADLLITDKTIQRLCEAHLHLYAASACSRVHVTKTEVVNAFARAFSLAVMMRKTINTVASSQVERALVASGIYAASLVQSRLGRSDSRSAVPPMHALNSEYLRGIDFHRDPMVKEVVLVARPLQDLMIKVQSLLALWPDHAILQQLVLIADRIRNFEISSPLARTLTGVELLLRKAQDWEAYAAKDYSIARELSALSALVTRWRKLELYSWPYLLQVKEKHHRLVAHKTWFSMYALLTAQFESDSAGADAAGSHEPDAPLARFFHVASGAKTELQWLRLNDLSAWVFTQPKVEATLSKLDSDASSTAQQQQWMSDLFSTLDAYVRSCSIGQYESRLLILYSFCAQLFMEFWAVRARGDAALAAKRSTYALATMLYHLYRYYAQHVGYMGRQWSGLKAPIQRKLVEYVKICRWDEQTYYSLAESAEKSHRKLMKYVRDYDAVLAVPMQTIIDASTDNGISKEGGFVGIHATRSDLDDVQDSVIVPVNSEKEALGGDADSAGDVEMEDGGASGDAKDKPVKKAADVVEEPETVRTPTLVLLKHVSQPSVVDAADGTNSVAAMMLRSSAYGDKLAALSKRISKYTREQILARDVVEARQQPSEVCEDLCETIFYRMHKLQHHAKTLPKGSKKKALIDLLSELKAQGMAYHRAHLPPQQQHMAQLFELDVPDVENCIHVDGLDALVVEREDAATIGFVSAKGSAKKRKSKKATKKSGSVASSSTATNAEPHVVAKDSPLWLWQRADGYYYRFISQLTSLRFSAVTSFSHDLSVSEVDRMNGYAENMLFSFIQQRQLLHAASLNHEELIRGLTTLERLKTFKTAFLRSERARVDLASVLRRQTHQYESVLSLQKPLKELYIVVLQVLQSSASSSGQSAHAKAQFTTVLDHVARVCKTFASTKGLTTALGVPAIAPHATLASNEDNGDAPVTAFAHASKRVYGVSPVLSVASTRASDAADVVLPVSLETLDANAEALVAILSGLSDIAAAFAQVAPAHCFDDIRSTLARVIADDAALRAAADAAVEEMASDETEATVAASVNAFVETYDKLVETVLVSIQDLTKLRPQAKRASGEDTRDDGDEETSLREQLTLLMTAVKDSRVNFIASQLSSLLALLTQQYEQVVETSSPQWRDAFTASLALVERLETSLLDVRAISRQLLVDVLVAHKSVAKLDYVLIRIFRNLYQHGFCRTEEKDGGESGGDGKMQFQDDVDGTGMGEGDGKKDVSDQIEDEEQLLGLQGDQQDEKPQDPPDQPEDTGLEMQNDFDGTMQDVPDDEKNDDDDDKDDEEELDREMGDFDQDDENVVDEKMWGDDSDDDEDKIDKENEKFEEDSKVEGEALEDEIRGKDGDDNDDKDNDDKDNDADDDKAKKEPPQADTHADDDNDGSDDDGSDVDGDKDDHVNDDFEDKYEENHENVDPQSRDDGQDEGDEDDAKQDEGDELPDNMQLDNDDDAGDDGDDEDGGDDGDEDMDKDEDASADEDPDEPEADKDEDEEPLDSAVQMGAGGLDDENEDAEEQDDNEDQDEKAAEDENASPEDKSSSTVAGTQAKDGQDELEQQDDDDAKDDDEKDADAQRHENDRDEQQPETSSSAQQQSRGDDNDETQEWKPTSQVSDQQQQQQKDEKRRKRNEPNPYRNPADAQEHWKRRVEMIERGDESKDQDDRKDSAESKAEMTTAEFVDDDDTNMDDVEHALAAADEQQIMNQTNADEDKDDADEDDAMDGAAAMDVDDDDVNKQDDADKDDAAADDKKPIKQQHERPERDHEADSKMLDPATDDESKTRDDADEPIRKDDGNDDVDMDDDDASPTAAFQSELERQLKELGVDDEDSEDDTSALPTLLTPDQVAALRDELDTFIANWSRSDDGAAAARGAELWSKYIALTAASSQRLCEQLRLVLEPMLRAKLEGDFRTGKRINMRKVIPYIASQFRKDKIWMRRTRPSKRQYQVMVAIDDSESMADNHAGRLALEAMTTLCKGMTQLEVGEIAVVKFGQDIELLHAFDTPFTDDAGSRVIAQFGFQQQKTNMVATLDAILQILETAKLASSSSNANASVEFTQIVFLISDGRFDTDGRMRIKKLIETALERQQLIVLLVVDQCDGDKDSSNSILETKSVTFTKGKVTMVPYLENYPFPYYVLLPTSTLLPEILSDSLRQWFEMLQMKR